MERLTTYISGYAHGKQGRTIALAEKSKDFCRGKFEATGIVERLAAYEDSGLSPEEVQKLKKLDASDASKEQCTIDQHGEIHRLRDELKRYKQAEQEGRLYNLPLKPGDTIYRPEALQFCWVITKVEIYEDEIVFIDDSDNIFRPDDIGKTVFLIREEAEAALKEHNEGGKPCYERKGKN